MYPLYGKKNISPLSHEMMREKVTSELAMLTQPAPASWAYRLCNHTGHHIYKGSALGLLLCCQHLKILNVLDTEVLKFHFALSPTNYVASSAYREAYYKSRNTISIATEFHIHLAHKIQKENVH